MRLISEYVDWEQYQAGAEDAHGNPVDAWLPAQTVGVYGFDPGATSAPRMTGHDRLIDVPTMYMLTDVVFGAHDRVTARGLLYEVEGVTREWRHPSKGWIGNVVTLKRVEG